MEQSIETALIGLLRGNAALISSTTGVGNASRIKMGWVNKDTVYPCITVNENNEPSQPRAGYFASKVRDNSPTIQVDIWLSSEHETFPYTNDDCKAIATIVDVLLIGTGLTNTRGWKRVSSSGPSPDPSDNRVIHMARRYAFDYTITD